MSTDTKTLPEHSALGASSAERWMACPGSYTLIELLKQAAKGRQEDEDPDFRRDGVQAHLLAAECLNTSIDAWEGVEKYKFVTVDMMEAVQVYLDYVRSRAGFRAIELRMHRPEFHPLMFGTTDAGVINLDDLEIIDYKHGIGIVVEVEDNPQIMYYAFMVLDELGIYDDDRPITLTIVQPRAPWHADGVIRSWTTTVGYIRNWAYETLRPAMQRVNLDAYLDVGAHCRFCPAKLVCVATLSVASRFAKLTLDDIREMNAEVLADLLGKVPVLYMVANALKQEARHRSIDQGKALPGWKVVNALADRVWKSDAPVAEKYGYQEPKLLSPAQVEKQAGKDGKKFVAEWAWKPNAGYDLVPVTDKRRAVDVTPSWELLKKGLDITDE